MPTRTLTPLSLTLALASALVVLAAAPAARPGAAAHPAGTAAPAALRSKLFHHLRHHQAFPATRAALMAQIEGAAELSADERRWIAERLEEGAFRAAPEVMRALFPEAPAHVLARLATGPSPDPAHPRTEPLR